MLYAGAASADPDFVVVQSPKQLLLSDERITRWFAARDGDVTLDPDAPTKIASMIDRKGIGNATSAADDALKPALSTLAAYGGRKAAIFAADADRSLAVPSVDFSSGPFFIAALVRRGAVNVANGDTLFWTGGGAGSPEVRVTATGSGTSFQFFVRGQGVNIPAGGSYPDAVPKLVFASYDGANAKGAIGTTGATVSAAISGGTLPSAGQPAFVGKRTFVPTTFWAGDVAQIIVGNVDILAPAHEDLRERIATYLGEYYGLSL
jgi:hypothetical protein